jgi:ribosomal protein L7/L12
VGYFDRDLPDELAGLLHGAEEPLPLDAVCAVIEADLGAAAGDVLHTLGSTPIAVGPLAQVHRSTLPDGSAIAVKVRRDDVADRLARELGALPEQVADCVRQECDYALAAQRQERFWWLYAGHAGVVVPALKRAYSGARVLTTERMQGVSLEKFLASGPSQDTRDRAGAALFDYYVGTLFEHGDYDCDPNPGKHLFLPDGRVAFVESTCTRELAPPFVAALAALSHALWSGDRALVVRAAAELGITMDGELVPSLLQAAYGPMLRDEVAAFAPPAAPMLPDLLRRWRDTTQPIASLEHYFLLGTMVGMGTMLAALGARANWYQRLQALLRAQPQPSFDVVLLHPGESAIMIVRALRDATGLPLRQIESFIKQSPQTIKQAVPRAEAEALRLRLEQAGAQIELKLV